jgi:hemolysin III
MSAYKVTYYRHKEEVMNVGTHLAGFILSLIGTIFLVRITLPSGELTEIIGVAIFGFSMSLLYLASTTYHFARTKKLRRQLNIFDHAAIYILIAGTYTPFCLVVLEEWLRVVMLTIIWTLAILGVIFKLKHTGKFNRLSTILYVAMGWIAVFVAKPLYNGLSDQSLTLLILGGLSYTIGAIIYMKHRLPYNHGIFHLFVLGGTISHFFSILQMIS